jgi:FkbM family methyltransferase
VLRHFAPAGLNHVLAWKSRFKAIGFDSSGALRASLSRSMRRALVESRIEQLPTSLRKSLSLVVDIGANEGQWISAFMTFAEVGRLAAFEPNPEAFTLLQARLGQRPNTRLHNLALGDEHSTVDLNVMNSSPMSSLLLPTELIRREYTPATEVVRQVPVKLVPLDDVITDDAPVDLMKIDVQGVEHSVLRGARKTLRRTRAVLIETNFTSHYLGDGSFGTLFSHLTTELGFEFWDVSPPYRSKAGQALWSDAVFLNRAIEKTV